MRVARQSGRYPVGEGAADLDGGTSRYSARRLTLCTLALLVLPALSACDQLGIETPQKAAEHQEADAKAVGGACRHAMRAIEDCYTLNPKADKAAVFGGWRDMDEYMRENKLDGVAPVVPRPPPPQAASKASAPASVPRNEDEDEDPDAEVDAKPAKGKAKAH